MQRCTIVIFITVVSYFVSLSPAIAQSTAFTYQGRLDENSLPAGGTFDLSFQLFDEVEAGNMVGNPQEITDVQIIDGLFTVTLDFGAVFDGTPMWLEIGIRDAASEGPYTTLNPRQPLTAVPLAMFSQEVADHDHGGLGIAVVSASTTGDPNTQPRQLMAAATCPIGKVVLGGGAAVEVVEANLGSQDNLAIQTSKPSDCEGDFPVVCTSWTVVATEVNSVNGTWQVSSSAICGDP